MTARGVIGGVGLALSVIALAGAARPSVIGDLPAGYPPLFVPDRNPVTEAKRDLGRNLFFERRLSADGSVSCADCHKPENGFADTAAVSRGAFGRHGARKAPSLLNVGYRPALMWDGRASDLESQFRLPLGDPNEMAMSEAAAVAVLARDASYPQQFRAAFGDPAITIDRIGQALATFERTALLGGGTPFERFMFQDDRHAIPAAAQRGWALFQAKGCITCHRFEGGNPLFTDAQFHNIGIGYDTAAPDPGRYRVTGRMPDCGRFKTPSLIGVAERAPYMHDGRFATLREVVDYYDRGAEPNPFLDAQLKPLRLGDADKTDLIAFLRTLSPTPAPAAGAGRDAVPANVVGAGARTAPQASACAVSQPGGSAACTSPCSDVRRVSYASQ